MYSVSWQVQEFIFAFNPVFWLLFNNQIFSPFFKLSKYRVALIGRPFPNFKIYLSFITIIQEVFYQNVHVPIHFQHTNVLIIYLSPSTLLCYFFYLVNCLFILFFPNLSTTFFSVCSNAHIYNHNGAYTLNYSPHQVSVERSLK